MSDDEKIELIRNMIYSHWQHCSEHYDEVMDELRERTGWSPREIEQYV